MKGALSRKKKGFWKPIVAGFLILYLVTMGLATLVVKEKFEDDYIRMFEQVATSIYRKAAEMEAPWGIRCLRMGQKGRNIISA